MRPQDIVALILAVGVVLILMSSTPISLFWMAPEDYLRAQESGDTELRAQFWRDVLNVILGALAGYIAGRRDNG